MTIPGEVSPLTLLESAREKYTLARARRDVPELALLSIHGAIEDTLRAHLLRIGSPAALGAFQGVIAAMAALPESPLSAEEIDAVQRLHRLRGRIARGEHLAVTGETLAAYQRLAVMLLPRYGMQGLAPPESESRARPTQPMRAHTTLPDDEPVRPRLRDRHTAYDETRRVRALGERAFDQPGPRMPFVPGWVAPTLIVVSIIIIGLAVALNLQSTEIPPLATAPAVELSPQPVVEPTAEVPPAAAELPTQPLPTPESTAEPSPNQNELAVGRRAVVASEIPALNVRIEPSVSADIVVVLAPATQVELINGPVERDGLQWWQIRSAGIEGWCAGQFLQPIP